MMQPAAGIVFGREGGVVVSAEADAALVIGPTGGEPLRIPARHVRGVAAFADQIWIVEGERPTLRRVDDRGRAIGEARALPADPGARLGVVPLGPPAATWGALAIYDDLGTLREQPAPACDLAIPLTARRWLALRGQRLELGNGVVAAVPRGVTRGEVICEGTAVALFGEADRELVVVTRSSGAVQRRVRLPSPAFAIAARRGLALFGVEPRLVEVVDLRSGRAVGQLRLAADVSDFAIDGDARMVALRYGAMTEIVELGAAMARNQLVAVPAADAAADAAAEVDGTVAAPAVAAGSGPAPAPGADAGPAPDSAPDPRGAREEPGARGEVIFDQLPRPLVLSALCPRPALPPIDLRAARRGLDVEIQTVGLRALLAIAHAWDTRRIGYADESAHPFEHEVAALLGMNGGFAREHVAAASARLAEHELGCRIDPEHRAPTGAIGAFAVELGLSPLALDILMIVAAPAIRGEVARLYGIVANDPGRAVVDELLVATLLDSHAERHEIARELDPRAPLVRSGAIRVTGDRPRPFAALAVDPAVLARLAGDTPLLPDAVTVRTEAPPLEAIAMPRALVYAAIAGLSRPSAAPARLAIRGRHGAGLRTLGAALAREAGRALAVVDATKLAAGLEAFRAAMATALRQAHLAGHLPCVIHLDRVAFEDRRGRDAIGDVLRGHPGPVAVCLPPDAPAPFEPGHVVIDVPATTETERHAAWARALAEAGVPVHDPAGLAARYRIGVAAIRRAVAAVAEVRATAPAPARGDAVAELEAYLRQDRELRIGEHARRVDRLATWSSLVLPPDVLDSLRELIGRVRHRRQVFDAWGMSRAMSTSRGLTALFSGQPGTGKTMVAGVLARELGLDLYQVDLSKVVSRWLGETERNLGAIFDAAEEGQCVLLFDEADSLFAKRTEVKSSNDRYANLEVNYLLQRLDSFEGIAILTTNFGGSIDPAFKRRMSFKLSFPFPDEETREQLWRVHLPAELPVVGPLDLAALSRRYQISGGYIRNACLRAAFLAAQEDTHVTHSHLERAVALEFAELGKLTSSGALD